MSDSNNMLSRVFGVVANGKSDECIDALQEKFQTFARLMQVPNEAVGLLNVVDNLRYVFSAHAAAFTADHSKEFSALSEITELTHARREEIATLDPELYISIHDEFARLDNFYGDYPLYAMAFHGTRVPHTRAIYALLQAHAIRAFIVIAPKLLPADKQLLVEFTRAVRAMGEPQFTRDLELLPDDEYEANIFSRCVGAIMGRHPAGSPMHNVLARGYRMLRDAANNRPLIIRRHEHGGSGNNGSSHPIRGVRPHPEFATEAKPLQNNPNITISATPTATPTTLLKARQFGVPEVDAVQCDEDLVLKKIPPRTPCYSIAEFAIITRQIRTAITRANASLPGYRTQDTDGAVCALLCRIETLLGSQSAEDIDAALVVVLMLFFSRPLEHWAGLRILTHDIRSKDLRDQSPCICLPRQTISLYTSFGEHQRRQKPSSREAARETTTRIELPLLPIIRDLAISCAQQYGALPFADAFKTRKQIQRITRFINACVAPTGNRLPISTITRWAGTQIATNPLFDAVVASFVANRVLPTSTAASYYFGPNSSEIASAYQHAMTSGLATIGLKRLCQNWPNLDDDADTNTKQTNGTVGCQIVPLRSTVQAVIKKLAREINDLKNPVTTEQFVARHNLITLYVTRMIAFACGYRAVTQPFPDLIAIELETGLVVISDKDGTSFVDSRVCWLPPGVVKQLIAFQQYMGTVVDMLSTTVGTLTAQHIRASQQRLPRNRENWINQHRTLSLDCFLLDSNGQRINPISVDMLNKLMQRYLPLPLNCNRSYLETELRAAGAPAWCINMQLGHWLYGQEPGAKDSTFSPVLLAQVIGPKLTKLMEDDGWTIIEA